MAITFGKSQGAAQQQQQQPAPPKPSFASRQPAQPAQPQATMAAPQASPFARAGGLPPATVEPGDGGTREKRDDEYWAQHPLTPGNYTLACYVKAVLWSSSNEVSVKFQAQDWDRTINRPGAHHQRPVPDRYGWKQTARPGFSEKGYANWRRDLVASYVACGFPEETWERDQSGGPVPPWHRFFVRECPDGSHIPIMLVVVCNVPPPNGTSLFCNIKQVYPLTVDGDKLVQAPMPFEVHPDLAAFHKWRHGEVKKIAGKDGSVTQLVPLDRDQFALGHLGMATYKDLP